VAGRAGTLAERRADFLDRPLLEVSQRKCRALERRQRLQHRVDPRAQLLPCGLAIGPGRRARESRKKRLGLVAAVLDDVFGAAADRVDGTVRGDAMDPRAEARSRLEPRQLPVRLQKGFLHHVLGILLVAHDSKCDAEDSPAVPLDERAERIPIAGPRLREDEVFSAVHGQRLDGARRNVLGPGAGCAGCGVLRCEVPGCRCPSPGPGLYYAFNAARTSSACVPTLTLSQRFATLPEASIR
jgi:hypothetical protein